MRSDFSAVLLAGGKSSRMGRNKAFLEIGGVPLWERQLRLLQQLEPREIFIAGPSRTQWCDRGAEIMEDAQENAGPLGGIVAALRKCAAPLLLVFALDLPMMTPDYLAGLLGLCSEEVGAVPTMAGKFEPLVAIYPAKSLDLAETCLREHALSLQEFVRRAVVLGLVRPATIPSSEERLFFNLNSPRDLAVVLGKGAAHQSLPRGA